jgi:Fe-S cluster biogenesis protein NfuA
MLRRRNVVDEKDFQKRVQRIGELVQNLETIADPAARAAAKELVQVLMDLHGAGLERILEIVFQSGDSGARVIDELGADSLVSSLLVLYGLHPESLQTRVEQKLKQIRSTLHKMGASAELVSVNGGDVHLWISVEGHTCGSSKSTMRTTVEEAMYEAAPDLTSLVMEGLDEPDASGFVALDALLGRPVPSPSSLQPVVVVGSEGMD